MKVNFLGELCLDLFGFNGSKTVMSKYTFLIYFFNHFLENVFTSRHENAISIQRQAFSMHLLRNTSFYSHFSGETPIAIGASEIKE